MVRDGAVDRTIVSARPYCALKLHAVVSPKAVALH